MPAYKFHDPRFTEHLLNGSFMLSSLDYFAALPWLTGDEKIGDIGESGARLIQTEPLAWRPGETPPNAEFLAEQGVIAVSKHFAGTINIAGMQVVSADEPAHIFSMAIGELDELSKGMPPEYGAVVEILDPYGLAHAMWAEGVTAAGTPLRELVREPRVEEVVYGGRTMDLNGTVAPNSGPFRKDAQYEPQRELRIHFPDAQQWVHDRLVVRIPQPDRFVGLVKRGAVPVNGPVYAEPELHEASVAALAAQRMGQDQTEVMRRLIWRWRLERGVRAHMKGPYDTGTCAWVILQDATQQGPRDSSVLVHVPS